MTSTGPDNHDQAPGTSMAGLRIAITPACPLELHYVKALFTHRRYRQCIQECRAFLDVPTNAHPLHETFATFYLGLAHDELARLMHDYSQTKLPAFDQAEQYYRRALDALPLDDVTSKVVDQRDVGGDPFFDGASSMSAEESVEAAGHQGLADFRSPPMSPSPKIRMEDIPTRSPEPASRETSVSDFSDLSSHDSFNDITTPHKVLQRDVSRMSLLDELKQPVKPRMMQSSMSQGLLRPIRRGSPTRQYHVPPRLPYTGEMSGLVPSKSRLPRLVTRRSQNTPTKARIPSMVPEEDVGSPVSPLGSVCAISETSTISPVSPTTPVQTSPMRGNTPTPIINRVYDLRISGHLEALRIQLETHLTMLDGARAETFQVQSDRAVSRLAAPRTTPQLAPLHQRANEQGNPGEGENRGSRRITPSRSYWSFKPEEVRVDEMQRRIQAGREKGWQRQRFSAQKSMELAEKALAEL